MLNHEKFSKLKSYSLFFASPSNLPIIIKENQFDNHFLACAVASGAKYIISGDQHLLKLKQFQKISILTSAQFLNNFRK